MRGCSDLAVLAQHGRSFRLAGSLLGRRMFSRAAGLYAVCRAIDDLADEAPDPVVAGDTLRALRQDIMRAQGGTALSRRLLDLKVDPQASLMLVETMLSDLQPVRIADEAALLRYAHGAAGTVGLMMCDVLQVVDATAKPRAVDLGIAMQLTNIARDVREDARRDRLYLPRDWLPPPASPTSLLDDRTAAFEAVQRLLALAERYYDSGALGYAALPGRASLAIPVAARLYQEIGRQILKIGPDYLSGPRHVIPARRRAVIVTGCLAQQAASRLMRFVAKCAMVESAKGGRLSTNRRRVLRNQDASNIS